MLTWLLTLRLSQQGVLRFGVAALQVNTSVRPRSFLPEPCGDLVFSVLPPSFAGLIPYQECPSFPIFLLKSSRVLLEVSLIHPPHPDPIPWVRSLCVANYTLWVSFFLIGLSFEGTEQISLPTS